MLDRDRIILMTKLASYEAGEGKKNLAVTKYFRGDYISLHILKAVFSGTIVYAIVVGVMFLYNTDFFVNDIYQLDLVQLGKKYALSYILSVGTYTLAMYVYASYRYNRARQSLKTYYSNLKKLEKYYEKS